VEQRSAYVKRRVQVSSQQKRQQNQQQHRSFVSSMSINVNSCFEVKPHQRRNEEGDIDDRKAFRLCICADDRDHLLDPSKWPNSSATSE